MSQNVAEDTVEECLNTIEQEKDSETVVVFMQGEIALPQSGYAQHVVESLQQILGFEGPYKTVNIIGDLEAYQVAFEKHTGTGDVPQIFVNGEFFVTGDEFIDLEEDGKLESRLRAQMDN